MIPRRIVLRDTGGELIPDRTIVLTGMQHADTRAAITAEVQQQCNMLHWHTLSRWNIPAWGNAEDPK